MLIEDQRFLHEDLERLEQAISDRIGEDPKHVRTGRLKLEMFFTFVNGNFRYEID